MFARAKQCSVAAASGVAVVVAAVELAVEQQLWFEQSAKNLVEISFKMKVIYRD